MARPDHRFARVRLALAAGLAIGLGGPGAAAEMPPMPTVVAWVTATGDNHGTPFVIVDKVAARVFLFDAGGVPAGSAPVLIGLARGDRSVPGVGTRPLAKITPAERTTPAGRFVGELGTDAAGHTILWVDYDNAIALHAVVTSNPAEHRLQRLASPLPGDHRISYGCINVPAVFFAQAIEPAFRPHGGMIYILPEENSVTQTFGIVSPVAREALPPRRPAAATLAESPD